jgi:rubrerythrin
MRDQTPVKMVESELIRDARDIFAEIRRRGEVSCRIDQIELYKEAQEIEEKTRDHYLENAEQATDEMEETLFLRLAEEEKKHYALLENIITLVSQPEIWLEDARWYHLDEY